MNYGKETYKKIMELKYKNRKPIESPFNFVKKNCAFDSDKTSSFLGNRDYTRKNLILPFTTKFWGRRILSLKLYITF